ncbi:hypothetical protein M9H77_14669 [Catharanthus roseus]|uniref:Uncharacterized protein n=1 Tax=Catharanthus roseus TaxID=4058 RepID=A0ACC0BNR9_CATRO|nr:hypothetical protein M9H77_14669 [Catharanthus roseus]
MFNKWQAQRWWAENYEKVMELYNVQRLNRQAFPLPTPPRSEDESSKIESLEDSPVTPPLSRERLPRTLYRPTGMGYSSSDSFDHRSTHSHHTFDTNGVASTPKLSSISGTKTETSSVDASMRTSSSRDADRSGDISISNASDLETEWVEQDEPGVYITIRALADGRRELRRVRFSRYNLLEHPWRLWSFEGSLGIRLEEMDRGEDEVSMNTTTSPYKPEEARVPPALPLPKPPFKIALCQLAVTADKERNIAHGRTAIEEAAEKGAQLVLLPEIWNSPYSNDSFPLYAEDIDAGGDASPSTAMLSEISRFLKITIIGGSIPERSGDKLYNTCCVFGTDGKLIGKHRKIHLFDIDIPGRMTFKESLTLTAGEIPTVVDTEVGRVGIGICYDIRFQELAAIYAARGSFRALGAHLICYPGAFNMTTGPLHWELLQRARAADCQLCDIAIEDIDVHWRHLHIYSHFYIPFLFMDLSAAYTYLQLYVATCSPARDTKSSYVAWGHSTLVGPNLPSIPETEARGPLSVGGCAEAEFIKSWLIQFL